METNFPGYASFFWLGEKRKRSVFAGRFAESDQESIADRLLRGTPQHLAEPPIIRHNAGPDRPKDCFWASLTVGPIISDRIVNLLREHSVTGWTTYPVRVVSRSGEELSGYQGLLPTSRCGQIDFTKGRPVPASYNPGVTYYIGGEFDPVTWDGADIFGSGTTVWIWVVERVKALLHQNGVTDIEFERLTEVEIDDSNARMMNGEPWWRKYGETEDEAQAKLKLLRQENREQVQRELAELRRRYGSSNETDE
jgi:hypothetical protein